MRDQVAAETLQQVEGARRRTRSDLTAFWFPLVLFGALTLVSAPVAVLSNAATLGAYWAVAGPVGGIATGWYYWRREQRLGVEGPALPYVATAVAVLVGALLAGGIGAASGSELASGAGPNLVVAAGLLVFAWLDRSAAVAALGGGLAGLVVVMAAAGVDPEVLVIVLALAFGTPSVLIGLTSRRGARSR